MDFLALFAAISALVSVSGSYPELLLWRWLCRGSACAQDLGTRTYIPHFLRCQWLHFASHGQDKAGDVGQLTGSQLECGFEHNPYPPVGYRWCCHCLPDIVFGNKYILLGEALAAFPDSSFYQELPEANHSQ